MANIEVILLQMKRHPLDVRFSDLCIERPGRGTRGSIFRITGGKAKAYQVRQVVKAIERLEGNHGIEK